MKKINLPYIGSSFFWAFLLTLTSSFGHASTLSQCNELAITVDKKEKEYLQYRIQKYGEQDTQVLILSILGLPESTCSSEDGRIVLTSIHRAIAAFDEFNTEQKDALKWSAQQYWRVWLCTIPNVQRNSPYDTRRTRLLSSSGGNFHSFELYPRMCPNGEPVVVDDKYQKPENSKTPSAEVPPITKSESAGKSSAERTMDSEDAVKKLLKIKQMYEAGVISEREYESLKVELMKLI